MLKSFLLLLFLAPVPQEAEEDFFELGKIQALFDEILPLVENETGKKFTKAPEIRIIKYYELKAILEEELLPLAKVAFPDYTEEEARDQARDQAIQLCGMVTGKYVLKEKAIVILPDTFRESAKKRNDPSFKSREMLRFTLIHETIHALDDHGEGALTRLFKNARTIEDFGIVNALMEGHAQYVTRRIYVRQKREKEFFDHEKKKFTLPPDMDEAEKFHAKMYYANFISAYVDGRRFFEALEKEGKNDFVDQVFHSPPKSMRVIYHPELYFHPELAPRLRDLTGLWNSMKKKYGEEWKSTIRKLTDAQMRASLGGLLPKEEEEDMMGSYLGGEVLIFQPRDVDTNKMVGLRVLEMESSRAANRAYDLMLRLHRRKDEMMKEGALGLTRSDYRKQETPNSDRSIAVERWINAQGTSIFVRDTMTVIGPFLIDHLTSGPEDGKDEGVKPVSEELQEICEFLKKKE